MMIQQQQRQQQKHSDHYQKKIFRSNSNDCSGTGTAEMNMQKNMCIKSRFSCSKFVIIRTSLLQFLLMKSVPLLLLTLLLIVRCNGFNVRYHQTAKFLPGTSVSATKMTNLLETCEVETTITVPKEQNTDNNKNRLTYRTSKVTMFSDDNKIIYNNDDSNKQEGQQSSSHDNDNNDNSTMEDQGKVEENFEDDVVEDNQRSTISSRASFLSKRTTSRRTTASSKGQKDTSVGPRRVGSATLNRQKGRATSKIMDALRKTAQGISSNNNKNNNNKSKEDNNNNDKKKGLNSNMVASQLCQPVIQSVIEEVLQKRSANSNNNNNGNIPSYHYQDMLKKTAAFSSFDRKATSTFGVLGETSSTTLENNSNEALLQKIPIMHTFAEDDNNICVRLATSDDDIDIANLRLSVFSDFSPDLQSQFCIRSCQAIAARRLRGAICIVVTSKRKTDGSSILLGSAECSYHEFFNTLLGQRRIKNSLLYITEVAVNPSARRRGIGTILLQAIDSIAKQQQNVETLYLHVDVSNDAAINLYKKAGYNIITSTNNMYYDFTKSLNLQPGATKGREHYLLYKNLTSEPIWLEEIPTSRTFINNNNNDYEGIMNNHNEQINSLGFEIPA